ncbi:MAG TPA: ABC transporter substrate-binding protein [Stellaceae bacterium]|nr:ABC transporter substrate-binding protein [Stellaceae bacterium]
MNIRRYSRRRLLGTAAAAGCGIAAGLAAPRLVFAQTKKAIKFTLPWVPEGSDLFAFTAKGMGFWDKHGLDVAVARGMGSVAAAEATGTGRFDFGMAAAPAAILQNVKGLPVAALACCQYDGTMGIGVLDDGPIKTPKDLEGHKLASTVTSGDYPLLPAYAAKAGFDLSKVTHLQTDPNVRNRLLPERKVDAISGFAVSIMPIYAATGVKAHFMLYSAVGLVNYGYVLLTQPQRVTAEPQLCAAFADGLLEGLKATMLDPAEAMKLFFKQVPEMALAAQSREQIRVGTGIMVDVAANPIIKEKGMGWIEPKAYEVQTDLVMKYLAKPGDKRPSMASMMTNRFVGSVRISAAEFERAQKNSQEFRRYVT